MSNLAVTVPIHCIQGLIETYWDGNERPNKSSFYLVTFLYSLFFLSRYHTWASYIQLQYFKVGKQSLHSNCVFNPLGDTFFHRPIWLWQNLTTYSYWHNACRIFTTTPIYFKTDHGMIKIEKRWRYITPQLPCFSILSQRSESSDSDCRLHWCHMAIWHFTRLVLFMWGMLKIAIHIFFTFQMFVWFFWIRLLLTSYLWTFLH